MGANDVVVDEWDLAQRTPVEWNDILEGYSRERQTAGQSEAAVFRLERQDRPTLFIKTEPVSSFSELPGEVARLHWLNENAVPCPQVLAETQDGDRHWLLMTGLPGRDLSSMQGFAPGRIVEIAATALRDLHELDATRCPFDHTLDRRLELASRRVAAGLVNEEDFDEGNLGWSAADLFKELLRNRPPHEDLVVTHGDATFSNLIVNGSGFSGFIDCGRLGVADRHQDLALMIREVQHDLRGEWADAFLRHYGYDVDRKWLRFFQLLDEFF
jgi:aminoglycoside 3'-phosphotransferase-2